MTEFQEIWVQSNGNHSSCELKVFEESKRCKKDLYNEDHINVTTATNLVFDQNSNSKLSLSRKANLSKDGCPYIQQTKKIGDAFPSVVGSDPTSVNYNSSSSEYDVDEDDHSFVMVPRFNHEAISFGSHHFCSMPERSLEKDNIVSSYAIETAKNQKKGSQDSLIEKLNQNLSMEKGNQSKIDLKASSLSDNRDKGHRHEQLQPKSSSLINKHIGSRSVAVNGEELESSDKMINIPKSENFTEKGCDYIEQLDPVSSSSPFASNHIFPSHNTLIPPSTQPYILNKEEFSNISQHAVASLLSQPDSFSGWLKKQSSSGILPFKSWKKRFVILTPSLMYIFKNEHPATLFHDVMLFNSVSSMEIIDKSRCIFRVTGENISEENRIKHYVFQSSDKLEMKFWCKALKSVFLHLRRLEEEDEMDYTSHSICMPINNNQGYPQRARKSSSSSSFVATSSRVSLDSRPPNSTGHSALRDRSLSNSSTNLPSDYLVHKIHQHYNDRKSDSFTHSIPPPLTDSKNSMSLYENTLNDFQSDLMLTTSSSNMVNHDQQSLTSNYRYSENGKDQDRKARRSRKSTAVSSSKGLVDIYGFVEQIQQLDQIRSSRSENIFMKESDKLKTS